MISSEQLQKIKNMADEVSRREGCRLYDVEFGGGHERVLRVYIDSEKEPVSIDQCANVSRGLSLLLDVEDVVPGQRYELEVSSPGVERILREPWHFQTAINKSIKVITFDRIPELKGEVKSLQGLLLRAEDTQITIQQGEQEVSVPYSNIKKAQVVFELKTKDKKR